jgi:hypothetical protein
LPSRLLPKPPFSMSARDAVLHRVLLLPMPGGMPASGPCPCHLVLVQSSFILPLKALKGLSAAIAAGGDRPRREARRS